LVKKEDYHCTKMHLLTYLLTYSMVQSPSWEANGFAASQEIPRISRNPNVHYRTHKRPPPVSILVQPNPVHIPTSQILEIRPDIIHPSKMHGQQNIKITLIIFDKENKLFTTLSLSLSLYIYIYVCVCVCVCVCVWLQFAQ